uniref:Uncharacterized protein n=3 Tax=Triticinae TaxID=1648030 RepID=A0A453NNU4_AEGTS
PQLPFEASNSQCPKLIPTPRRQEPNTIEATREDPRKTMGGCFSSSGAYEEAGCRRPQRVRPSDQDGIYYVGERDVDNKAGIYIANFHRYQSEVVPMTPAPSSAAA